MKSFLKKNMIKNNKIFLNRTLESGPILSSGILRKYQKLIDKELCEDIDLIFVLTKHKK